MQFSARRTILCRNLHHMQARFPAGFFMSKISNGCIFSFLFRNPSAGGDCMSPKELLYIDDALGHEKFLISQCQQAAKALTDPTLKNSVQRMLAAHQDLFNQFYQLV